MNVFEDRKWNLRETGFASVSLYAVQDFDIRTLGPHVQDFDRSRRKSVRWNGA